MGAEPSKETRKSSGDGNNFGPTIDFPNALNKDEEVSSWSLLHQCTVDNWKQGHAEAANFPDSILTCDRTLHKDCSSAFCMSRQGVINIDRSTSVFSFRRRTKFAKMAEHFEYNHIPAQMSSVNHFRVKSVLCFRDSLVVLHLSRNGNSQFGLLDLEINKFLGVFGKQPVEYANENFAGELSPDKSKCLVLKPRMFRTPYSQSSAADDSTNYSRVAGPLPDSLRDQTPSPLHHSGSNHQLPRAEGGQASNIADRAPSEDEEGPDVGDVPLAELLLFDMSSKLLLSRVPLKDTICHFSFDPRHSWCRVAVTNFGWENGENSLSLVELMPPSPDKTSTNNATSGAATSAHSIQASKTHKVTEQQAKYNSNVVDWTWSINAMNYRLSDTWEEDNLVLGGTQRRSSSSGSSSSSSSSDLLSSQKVVDLRHSRDGRLLVATMLELGECRCREKRSGGIRNGEDAGVFGGVRAARRLHQIQPHRLYGSRYHRYHSNLPAVNCSLYIFDADSARTLRCIQYHRYACRLHTCPTNYVPVFSACGTRMAVAMDVVTHVPPSDTSLPLAPVARSQTGPDRSGRRRHRRCRSPMPHYVQVYRLPSPALCLQALCRAVLLESRLPIAELTLPPKMINYLKFGPEFY